MALNESVRFCSHQFLTFITIKSTYCIKMPPQENQFFSEVISEPMVMLHVFGNPANEFVKNMGIMHARNQAKAGYEAPVPLIHKYALVHPGGLWTFHEDLSDISLAKGPKLDLTQAII